MATDFRATAKNLGDFAVVIQEANRYVILAVGAATSPVGISIFILLLLVFGSIASAFGYADLMYITRLQAEASNTGLDIASAEVKALAHESAFWNGLPLMLVVGGFILILDLLGFETGAIVGAAIEFLLGSAGFVYRALDMDFHGIKFWAMIICGSIFIAASPIYMHVLARKMHEDFAPYYMAVRDNFNKLLKKDFENIMK